MDIIEHTYNNIISSHYAAFRPPLHKEILSRLIRPDEYFKIALDVGCGTGCSTIALAEYCDHIVGMDSNQAMLDQAITHPRITYFYGNGGDFNIFEQGHFDIVSFAGSLSYMKTNKLKSELMRMLIQEGVVLVYDFKVLLDDLMVSMDMNITASVSGYNFVENFNDWPEFAPELLETDIVPLNLTAQQVTHILLANSYRYQEFQNRFKKNDPFDCLIDYIRHQDNEQKFEAEIYYSRYSFYK